MAENSGKIDKAKLAFSTRIGSGKARHVEHIDARSLWARRDREVYNALISDLGGADRLSELEHQVVRRAVGLILQCEQFEVLLAEGKPVDTVKAATLINTFNRTAGMLGLKRRAKDITPHLETYLAERYSPDNEGKQ
jgi:hypothetical protein